MFCDYSLQFEQGAGARPKHSENVPVNIFTTFAPTLPGRCNLAHSMPKTVPNPDPRTTNQARPKTQNRPRPEHNHPLHRNVHFDEAPCSISIKSSTAPGRRAQPAVWSHFKKCNVLWVVKMLVSLRRGAKNGSKGRSLWALVAKIKSKGILIFLYFVFAFWLNFKEYW